MKQALLILFGSVTLLGAAESRHNLFRVPHATDVTGQIRRFGEASTTRAVVFIFLGPECPISQRYIPKLNRMATARDTNAVEFFGVIAGQTMTRTQAVAFATEYAIRFPVLFDDGLALARWLRPTHMPEAFVLKPDGDVVYHGRIDDWYQSPGKPRAAAQQHELQDALTAVLAGKSPRKIFAQPVGCYFEDWPDRR